MEIFILTVYIMFCFGFAARTVSKYAERDGKNVGFALFVVVAIAMPIFLGYMVVEKLWFD